MATALTYLTAALAGIFTWSLAEYVLHRFLGHEFNTKVRFKKEHLKHHFLENYFAPTRVKALIATIVVSVTWAAITPLLGFKLACVYSISFTGFYLYYEYLHRSLHVRPAKTKWGVFLREHHLHHHQRGIKANYGVTSHLWDLIFRTYQSPSGAGRAGSNEGPDSKHDEGHGQFNKDRRSIA
ncbi:MAG: sterol desaturase family protein [Proteobacteria bacterium]|nr:sterol desaturase family protein [Pseudomonadota bacterium]